MLTSLGLLVLVRQVVRTFGLTVRKDYVYNATHENTYATPWLIS
jgi:hypothetical protein